MKSILVIYKDGSGKMIQIPCVSISVAKGKADNLYKRGYLNIKVVKAKEELIYIPGDI
ncbi:MAG: hypothetical protein E6X34_11415 [Clostridium sp.]|uniref:hypothetical protein n=1 Tax=Clostridium sp. TaxID=1506 RepID=UPI00290AF83E|nr:hypothetical protein [Clostridium sp.]MDU4939053.1 hypothetical protein [Clostridium sp.]